MFAKKIEIDRSLYESLETAARSRGYANTDEFIRHVLELVAGGDKSSDEDPIRERLKGLGYLE